MTFEGAGDNMTNPSEPGHGRTEPGLSALMSERRHLTNLAYRLLGSLADAEDVVQETYARWYALSPQQQEAIDAPGAWLTTVASRICLDLLGSARARRERYVGSWIPEPLPDRMEWISGRASAPSIRLTRSPSTSRSTWPSSSYSKQAWRTGNIDALIDLLAPDATATGDGGGLVTAVLHPVEGAEQVARFIADRPAAAPDVTLVERTVNGQPGLVVQRDGVTVSVMAFEVAGDRIQHIWAVLNPDKLRSWRTV